jgi:hypothetical protein
MFTKEWRSEPSAKLSVLSFNTKSRLLLKPTAVPLTDLPCLLNPHMLTDVETLRERVASAPLTYSSPCTVQVHGQFVLVKRCCFSLGSPLQHDRAPPPSSQQHESKRDVVRCKFECGPSAACRWPELRMRGGRRRLYTHPAGRLVFCPVGSDQPIAGEKRLPSCNWWGAPRGPA